MASLYPSGLDTLNTSHVDSVGEVIHAGDVNNLADAVNKIETELGTLPKGAFTSVSAKLGALFYGSVTTTQRDALTAGNRPKGLIVFNTTTNRYEFNSGTDVTPTWSPVGPAGPWGTTDLVDAAVTTVKLAANSVTFAKVASDVPVVPIGSVMDWPWSSGTTPAWAGLPAGQAISRTTFAALFAIANATGLTTHGAGDGSTTFNIPDYRGRIGAGKDDMGGTAANRITLAISGVAGTTLGAVFGSEGVTLTTAQLPAHNHGVTGSPSITDPGHFHSISGGGGAGPNTFTGASGGGAVTTTNSSTTGITLGVGTLSTVNSGGGAVHQNTQPSIVVNKIMRIS